MHMSRPSSVWLALKHLEWFDCVGGCTVTSGDTKGETERKQSILQCQIMGENQDDKARFSCSKKEVRLDD